MMSNAVLGLTEALSVGSWQDGCVCSWQDGRVCVISEVYSQWLCKVRQISQCVNKWDRAKPLDVKW